MRVHIYSEVYMTFLNHIWTEEEKFYVKRVEFCQKMNSHPLNLFLKTSTIRKMIFMRLSQTSRKHKSRRPMDYKPEFDTIITNEHT